MRASNSSGCVIHPFAALALLGVGAAFLPVSLLCSIPRPADSVRWCAGGVGRASGAPLAVAHGRQINISSVFVLFFVFMQSLYFFWCFLALRSVTNFS